MPLGYVLIGMRDPGEWRQVGQEILGFSPSPSACGGVVLKMDSAPFRYLIENTDTEGFICAGWEYSVDGYYELLSNLTEHSIEFVEGEADACAIRQVAAFVLFEDPSGNQVEVFHTRANSAPFVSPMNINFVADDLGVGHVVLPAIEHADTCDFYEKVLGFALADELILHPPAE